MLRKWLVCAGVLALNMSSALAEKAEPTPTPVETAPPGAPTGGPGDAPSEAPPGDQAVAEDPFANAPRIIGPQLVDLGHGAEIDLPAGLILFEHAVAQDMMRQAGNDPDGVLAVILPPADATWMVVIGADDVGYVSDDDAHELDAASMLEQFKLGTLEQNKQRKAMGIPELFIDGWSEPPRYEASVHHLVWGIRAHAVDGEVINFFTRFLGRHGYLSVNLIDDPAAIERSKTQALAILTAVRYRAGHRYEDHVDGDKDSGMGLKALVLGGTGVAIAKKTGILVAILLFLKKGFVVVLAGLAGLGKWLLGRKKAAPPAPPAPTDQDTPATDD